MPRFIEDLRPASFRGVGFLVDDDETMLGNRTAKYEYPGRHGAEHEQMGRMAGGFVVRAAVIGEGFVAAAAALEEALLKEGAGQLIHPHYGEKTVVVLDVRRQHSASAVGEVRFQITFEETVNASYPVKATDTAAALGLASGNLFSAIETQFNAVFNGSALPDFLIEDALGRANAFTAQAEQLLSRNGVLNMIGGSLPAWTSLATDFAANVTGLFRRIADFAKPKSAPLIGAAATGNAPQMRPQGILAALSDATTLRLTDALSGTSASAASRVRNAAALDGLFRGAAMAGLGAAARYATFDSREDAIAFRDLSADRMLALRDDYGAAGWDDAWAKSGLQLAALSRDINERIGRLPRTLTVSPQVVRPSIALAHRLYGDNLGDLFTRAGDIVTRNRVRHPAFVPADRLEVLVDGK